MANVDIDDIEDGIDGLAGIYPARPPPPVSEGDFAVRLENAFEVLAFVFSEIGMTLDTSFQGTVPKKAGKHGHDPAQMDRCSLFTRKQQHIPGQTMHLCESIAVPSPKGLRLVTRGEVDEYLQGLVLTDMESKAVLQRYSYIELDEMRFAFVALALLLRNGCFTAEGKLTPLAKRDVRKNCRPQDFTALRPGGGDSAGAPPAAAPEPAKPAAGQPAAAAAAAPPVRRGKYAPAPPPPGPVAQEKPEKYLKNLLMDECKKLWPHTPAEKAAIITVVSDPAQPRHKPMFQGTVELTMAKRSFKGAWCNNKKDAENAAGDAALQYFYSGEAAAKCKK